MSDWFQAEQICAGYGKREVIRDINFSVPVHTLTGLLGENGCGKTTLLKCIAGRLPYKGSCLLDGEQMEGLSVRQMARRVSYIPQKSGIAVSLPVIDVVLMGFNPVLGLLEQPSKKQREQALGALEKVGLANMAETEYLKLSEGQKQLVILARTFIEDGKLLLLDEPDSALDVANRYQMLKMIRQMVNTQKKAGILCLHDPILALEFCDQLVMIKDGRCVDYVYPQKDGITRLEHAFRQLYGGISLGECTDRKGNRHHVMMWEDERCGQ